MIRRIILFFSLVIAVSVQGQITISGFVTDESTGEQLLFASVYEEKSSIGTVTNEYGYFSISLPSDSVRLSISYLGYVTKVFLVTKDNLGTIKFSLKPESNQLEVVEINVTKTSQEELHNSTQMSSVRIPIKDIKFIPAIGGESDVIKVIQLMPGVQRGGEGGTGMYVRGGDVDQNLVLLDEAVVYNIGHLFGFFSVFNQDAIKDMTLYKGAFPANYGGRLSSALDIRMNEGDNQHIHGRGGVGLLSSRFMIESPIKKDKASFMLAGRRTYIDQVFKWAGSFMPYYFYDLNAKLNYTVDEKNKIYFSTYYGNDVLSFDSEDVRDDGFFNFGFTLGNLTSTLRWNHIIDDKKFANYSLIYTNFDYNINGKFDDNSLYISSAINDYGLKVDYDYYKSPQKKFKYGYQGVFHQLSPNIANTQGEISEIISSNDVSVLNSFEWGAYAMEVLKKDSSDWEFSLGARVSGVFVPDKAYAGIEPRIAVKYDINKSQNLKLSLSTMRQYMHLVSSSTVALPTDLWYPVTANVKPQSSHQIAGAYSYFWDKFKTNFTIEGYYKYMLNLTEYKEGANLVLNDDFESELLQGNGDAYGVEALVKKDGGRWNGWIGYTLSWSKRYFDDLNQGDPYFAKYDRRHNLSVVQNLQISPRWYFSAVWVYSTGSRFTPQIGFYSMPNASGTGVELIPVYTKRNAVQMSASHRLDVNFVFRSKETKKFKGEWHFGAYNVYNQATPWTIEVVQNNNGGYEYSQNGLFGFIPSIAYNFEF